MRAAVARRRSSQLASRFWGLLQVLQRIEAKQTQGDNATGLRKYGEALLAYDEALKNVPERHSLRAQLHGSKAAVFLMDGKCASHQFSSICAYETVFLVYGYSALKGSGNSCFGGDEALPPVFFPIVCNVIRRPSQPTRPPHSSSYRQSTSQIIPTICLYGNFMWTNASLCG
jgi:hypothetical protein